jgi:hypothetical protein
MCQDTIGNLPLNGDVYGGHASQPREEHWLSVGYSKSVLVTKDSLFTTLAINRRFSHYRHALIIATP